MSTYINVARYHLVQRFNYLILPWAILAFVFVVDVVILALTPAGHSSHRYVGGLASLFVIVVRPRRAERRPVPALRSGPRSQPPLLLSRDCAARRRPRRGRRGGRHRGQAIERSTSGWGLAMGFFRVPYILDGPWYLTWLTSFVVLTLLFVYGMWFGLVYRRWSLVGPRRLHRRSDHRAGDRGARRDAGPTPGTTSAISSPPSAPRDSPASSLLSRSCCSPAASPPCAG